MKNWTIVTALSTLAFATLAHAAPSAKKPPKSEKKEAPAAASSAAPTSTTEVTSATADKEKEPDDDAAKPSKAAKPISLGAVLGVGFNETKIKTDSGQETQDGVGMYGVGLGLRGGYTLPMHVYVGGAFVYHAGGSNDAKNVKYEGSVFYLGPEVGYDLLVGPVTLRPYAGFGYGAAKAKAEAGGGALKVERSEGGLALWPGALVTYPVIENVFVGVDARYAVVTGTDKITSANGFGAFLTGGAAF